jgi:Asp-tRNA(Asn)/Glu-tRNA(Gln) amidotransferase A subunit family amidase
MELFVVYTFNLQMGNETDFKFIEMNIIQLLILFHFFISFQDKKKKRRKEEKKNMFSVFTFISLLLTLVQTNLQTTTVPAIEHFNIEGIHNLILTKRANCSQITNYFLQRSKNYNRIIKAIISYNPKAMEEAAQLDVYYKTNHKLFGRLHCIPVLVKDNIDVKGIPTTGGIRALAQLIPRKHSVVVERLVNAGAIIISKANLKEMAEYNYDSEMGGECRNPFDLRHRCGESSSGSGAGIASGMAIIGIGTDTSLSIICPASYCGIYGLRPPIDAKILEGVIPLLDRTDTVGPMTKYLNDMVLTYAVMADNDSIYDHFKLNNNENKLKLFIIIDSFNTFNIKIGSNKTFNYHIDPIVRDVFIKGAIEPFNSSLLIKNNNIEVVIKRLDAKELQEASNVYHKILDCFFDCLTSSYKRSMELYMYDIERFDHTSPYQTYEQLAHSNLLLPDVRAQFLKSIVEHLPNKTSKGNFVTIF